MLMLEMTLLIDDLYHISLSLFILSSWDAATSLAVSRTTPLRVLAIQRRRLSLVFLPDPYTHLSNPLFFPSPTVSPPTQNLCNVFGKSSPSTFPSSPNLAPFSNRATKSLGIAAAVPLRVCAKGSPS